MQALLRKAIGICAVAGLLVSCAEPVSPKRTFFKISEPGANLEVTMKFIQDALTSIDSFEYSDSVVQIMGGETVKFAKFRGAQYLKDVVADPRTCQIQYRIQQIYDGKTKVIGEKARQIDLKQALEAKAFSQKEQLEGGNQVSGPGAWFHDFSPPIYDLQVRTEPANDQSILVFDQELANEIAEEINYAINLCRQH
jgi:hypothetical protein